MRKRNDLSRGVNMGGYLPVRWVMNWLLAAYSSCCSQDISIILQRSDSQIDKKRSHLTTALYVCMYVCMNVCRGGIDRSPQ